MAPPGKITRGKAQMAGNLASGSSWTSANGNHQEWPACPVRPVEPWVLRRSWSLGEGSAALTASPWHKTERQSVGCTPGVAQPSTFGCVPERVGAGSQVYAHLCSQQRYNSQQVEPAQCPAADGWIHKTWSIHTVGCDSAFKGGKF